MVDIPTWENRQGFIESTREDQPPLQEISELRQKYGKLREDYDALVVENGKLQETLEKTLAALANAVEEKEKNPICPACGSEMLKDGTTYLCLNCKERSGCS